MFLHIGEKRDFYNRRSHWGKPRNLLQNQPTRQHPFSGLGGCLFFFPCSNQQHQTAQGGFVARCLQLHCRRLCQRTHRQITHNACRDGRSSDSAKKFKANNFDYCTFSGTFTSRSDKALIQHSGLLCVDFDHLKDVSTLFQRLLNDEYFDTQLLFRSPSGDGLKWIIPIDTTTATHADFFRAIANYIQQTYGIEADKSGKDISRACFLPHDPQAFINSRYKKQ